MKKSTLYAKKTLSVFMAVMMLLSAWVFVPGEHNHASAVSSATVSTTNTGAVSKFTDSSFGTGFTTLSGNFHGDNASTMASRGYYKNVLYSPHFPASNNNLNNSDSGVYFGTLGGTADGARVWYPETTIIWDGSTTPQIPILFDIDSNNNNRVGVKNVYISSGANGLTFKDSYWTAKSECAKDTNYYTHFTFDWIMQNNSGNYWISTSSGNDKESMCSSNGYWDIYGTYLQYTGGSFGSGSTYYKAITPTWVCRTGSNYTGTTNKTIYVIDYVPLKNALNNVKTLINEVKANPAKYTTASVSALASAADKLIAAKPNNYINSSVNDVYNWNSAVSSALSDYNSAKNLVIQKYTLEFVDVNGNVAYSKDYDYGSSINIKSIASGLQNSVKKIDGNDSYHQAYAWDAQYDNVTTIVNSITVTEVATNQVGHSFPASATQGDENHTWTCSACGYVKSQAHTSVGAQTTAPTCTTPGEKTYTCSTCGKFIKTEAVPALTHDFRGEIVENVTGENGNHWQKCTRCDVYGWGTNADACENHNWDKNADGTVDASDAIETKASTCKDAGYEKYECKVCAATFTKTLALAAHKAVKTDAKVVTNICGGDGNEAFWTCSVCDRVWKDEALTDEVTDLTDADNDKIPDVLETKGPEHEFTGAYASVSGGADGTHHRQCKRFTQCNTYGPEEKHKYGDPDVTAATCTSTGKEVYTCSDCKQTYEVTLGKVAHSMTKFDAVAAECNKAGNNEYYYCSACKTYYKDAAGATVTTVDSEKLPALEHKWSAHHDYDTLNEAATCMAAALYNKHCDYCKVKISGTYSYGGVDLVNGHKFDGAIQKNADGTHSYKCTVEGCAEYGNATTCEFTKVKTDVASTCHTIGYTIYECTTCKAEKRVEKTSYDFDNHDGDEEIRNALEAKCNSNGYTGDTYCLGCKTKIKTGEAIVADKSLHPHVDMKDYAAQDSTCQAEGWKAYKYCSACATYEIAKETVAKKDHKFTSYTSNNNGTHTATCGTCDAAVAAPVTDTKNCSGGTANCVDTAVCAICQGSYGSIDEANHKAVTTIDEVKATCQVKGKTAYKYCSACQKNVTEPQDIDTIAHVWGNWSKVDGEDSHKRSCLKCVDTDTLDIATETEACSGGVAFCNAQAICDTCKVGYGELDPANHKSEAWHYADNKKDATCQAEGYTGDKHYDCCHVIMELGEVIEMKAHNFSIEASKTPATCIAEGSVTYKCSNCVESEGVTAATKTETLPINAKNHATKETEVVNAKEATCETDGNTGDTVYKCCKALISKGTVIKANGQHVFGTIVPEYMLDTTATVEAQEGEAADTSLKLKAEEPDYDGKVAARHDDGKWYHAKQCSICQEVVFEACYTYEHTYSCKNTDICYECEGLCSLIDENKHNVGKVDGTEATETEKGKKAYFECKDCGKCFLDEIATKEFDPTADENGDGIPDALEIPVVAPTCEWSKDPYEVAEATCVADGYKKYKCTDEACDKIKEVKIPATGIHTWTKADGKDNYIVTDEPTCGENGYEAIQCTVCKEAIKSNSYVSIPATGLHTYDLIGTTQGTSCTDPSILTYKCKVCGDTYDIASTEGISAHKWGEWITKGGDCSTGVIQVRTCSSCQTQEQKFATTVDHELVIKVKVEATCETDGYIDRVCKNCGYAPEREIIPATSDDEGHVINPELYRTVEKASCESAELRQYTCVLCGEKVTQYYGDPLKHTWLLQSAEIATCSRDGHGEYYRCVRCEIVEEEPEIYKATGHVDNDGNNRCDECNGVYYEGGNEPCDCMCHNESFFMRIIYKIFRFFWSLFKTNPSCACGNVHY